MIRDDSCFYLQRSNPTSNMHTYNPVKLNRVKAKEYGALLGESAFPDDADMLMGEMKKAVHRYFDALQTEPGHGESDENVAEMQKLLKSVDAFHVSELHRQGLKEFCRYRKSCRDRRKGAKRAASSESRRTGAANAAGDAPKPPPFPLRPMLLIVRTGGIKRVRAWLRRSQKGSELFFRAMRERMMNAGEGPAAQEVSCVWNPSTVCACLRNAICHQAGLG